MITLLKTTVGSLAHGTSTPDSDIDTRVIYAVPTREVVGIGNYQKFIENKEADENSWELAHFIYLTLRCNPTTLEVLKTPLIDYKNDWGQELLNLFPYFLNRKHIYNAFKGFAESQRRKMVSPTTNYFRKPKAASHYLRVLCNGIELLTNGDFNVRVIDGPYGKDILAAKMDELLFEEVLQIGDDLSVKLDKAYDNSSLPLETNKTPINDFLLKVRKEYW